MLQVEGIVAGYRGTTVLYDVSLEVPRGEIVVIVGSNGAGKSTLLKVISGLVPPRSGSVRFRDQEITNFPPHEVIKKGIALVPEGRRVFGKLSVLENLLMGAYCVRDEAAISSTLQFVFNLFPVLEDRRKQKAETLSGGEQQMLAIARALMSSPELLMLDEPSLGLMPAFVKEVFKTIRTLSKQGKTILLVEQNVQRALQLADHAYVLQNGKVVLSGTGDNLIRHPLVRKAYLGVA